MSESEQERPPQQQETAFLGQHTLMEEAVRPNQIAPSYIFLAANRLSSYSGEVLAPTGGETLPG